jgi:hypothetical protein
LATAVWILAGAFDPFRAHLDAISKLEAAGHRQHR